MTAPRYAVLVGSQQDTKAPLSATKQSTGIDDTLHDVGIVAEDTVAKKQTEGEPEAARDESEQSPSRSKKRSRDHEALLEEGILVSDEKEISTTPTKRPRTLEVSAQTDEGSPSKSSQIIIEDDSTNVVDLTQSDEEEEVTAAASEAQVSPQKPDKGKERIRVNIDLKEDEHKGQSEQEDSDEGLSDTEKKERKKAQDVPLPSIADTSSTSVAGLYEPYSVAQYTLVVETLEPKEEPAVAPSKNVVSHYFKADTKKTKAGRAKAARGRGRGK